MSIYHIQKFKKIDIAKEYIETAILHYEDKKYFQALHLAGAAEELIGKLLRKEKIKTSLESEKEDFVLFNKLVMKRDISEKHAADFLNKSKNAIKHLDETNPKDEYIELDPKEDANNLLKRAIKNLWRLEGELSPSMEKFW